MGIESAIKKLCYYLKASLTQSLDYLPNTIETLIDTFLAKNPSLFLKPSCLANALESSSYRIITAVTTRRCSSKADTHDFSLPRTNEQ
jgi:hypothetical protein